jgi:hypothetical protein
MHPMPIDTNLSMTTPSEKRVSNPNDSSQLETIEYMSVVHKSTMLNCVYGYAISLAKNETLFMLTTCIHGDVHNAPMTAVFC